MLAFHEVAEYFQKHHNWHCRLAYGGSFCSVFSATGHRLHEFRTTAEFEAWFREETKPKPPTRFVVEVPSDSLNAVRAEEVLTELSIRRIDPRCRVMKE